MLFLQKRRVPVWCSMGPCRGRRRKRWLLDSGLAGRGKSMHGESLGQGPEERYSQIPISRLLSLKVATPPYKGRVLGLLAAL